uniref:Uncharacterized protein n=1 Tax=Cannabis sativa TaxID=3483 RepID=A0A803PU78_CANSA
MYLNSSVAETNIIILRHCETMSSYHRKKITIRGQENQRQNGRKVAHACRIQSVKAMAVIDSDGPDILLSFNQGEASELEHPHDNALVITLDVAHVRMKHMLVDTGSSANNLFAGVLKEMEIEDLKAQDTQVTLVGFSGESAVA